jgi:hypothetical protein
MDRDGFIYVFADTTKVVISGHPFSAQKIL